MYPYLLPEIFGYTVPLYDLLIAVGIASMLFFVSRRFETHDGFSRKQTNKLLLLIAASLLFALLSSFLFDGVFHSIKEGELSFGTISFLGGLMGGVACLLVLLKVVFKADDKSIKTIMNTVIVGVVLAHGFGRIGCFLAGCCYGIPTDSFLGVVFPHGHAHEAFPGISIFPTQLFEAVFLFALFFVLANLKRWKGKELEIYMIAYSVWRILLELIRGDDRGSLLGFITTEYNVFPTPSQYLSLLMIAGGVYLLIRSQKKAKKQQDASLK
jgi:phosphatidylglycerol:prolipoprotein diacylglycerol transferase